MRLQRFLLAAAVAASAALLIAGGARAPETDAAIICEGHGNVIAPFDGQTPPRQSMILCCTGLFVERTKSDRKYVRGGENPWFGVDDPGPVPEFESKAKRLCARENRGGILLKQSPVRIICNDGTGFITRLKRARGGCETVPEFGAEARVRKATGHDQLCLGTLKLDAANKWVWQKAAAPTGPCK